MAHIEEKITQKVAPILQQKSQSWTLRTEERVLVNQARRPDIFMTKASHHPIVIEAKWADSQAKTNDVLAQARSHFGKKLKPPFNEYGNSVQAVMALKYPVYLKEEPEAQLEKAVAACTEFEYMLINRYRDGETRFPRAGFAKGSLADVAMALHLGAVPMETLTAATEKLEQEINAAADELQKAVKHHPAIGEELAGILNQPSGIQTYRMSCLIIMEAFAFQSAIAGNDENYEELGEVRSPNWHSHNTDWREVVDDWNWILEVNYYPIFKVAVSLVEAIAKYDMRVNTVLQSLCNAALRVNETQLGQVHELLGIVLQELIVDRKFVKANYTLPESAALLSALVCPNLPEDDTLPKVADLACGTGALLNGVYKRIQRLHEVRGNNPRDIHVEMLENNLAGSDIYPHCTHLTFAAMAGAFPKEILGATRVITAPYGEQEDRTYAIGSLELLDSEQLEISELTHQAEQLGGHRGVTVDFKRTFANGEFDIIIQNPPFAAANADSNSQVKKTAFDGSGHTHDDKKAMLAALKTKNPKIGDMDNGLGSYFVELADIKLRNDGRMGFILPIATLSGTAGEKARKLWATEYHDVIVVTVAATRIYDCAFSHDTGMAECIVVATKGVGENTGRAKFVCLTERPADLLSAEMLAKQIREMQTTRHFEDAPEGSDTLYLGDVATGQVLDCPIDDDVWGVTRTASMQLTQTMYHLKQGNLLLPNAPARKAIPICQFEDIALTGLSHDVIKHEKRGAFEMHEIAQSPNEGYDALWQVHAQTQRAIKTLPDYKAKAKPHKTESANRIRQRMSRAHYHTNLGYPANSILASWTEKPSIGVRSLTNVVFENPRHEAAWTLWANSSLGLLCHWMHAGKQQGARGMMVLGNVKTLPTLDVRELSDKQLDEAEAIIKRIKVYRMLPYNECTHDAWRHVLDAWVLTILGITDNAVHEAMQPFREMLAAEPSIRGVKKSKTDLAKERAEYGIPGTSADDACALSREREFLAARGIVLPGLDATIP